MKGFEVAPSELEGYLLGHPDVADADLHAEDYEGELPRAYVGLWCEGYRRRVCRGTSRRKKPLRE